MGILKDALNDWATGDEGSATSSKKPSNGSGLKTEFKKGFAEWAQGDPKVVASIEATEAKAKKVVIGATKRVAQLPVAALGALVFGRNQDATEKPVLPDRKPQKLLSGEVAQQDDDDVIEGEYREL